LRSNELQLKKSLFSLKQSIKIQRGSPYSKTKEQNSESLTQKLSKSSSPFFQKIQKIQKNKEFQIQVYDISRTVSRTIEENKDESDENEESFMKLKEENQKLKKFLSEMVDGNVNQNVEIGFSEKG